MTFTAFWLILFSVILHVSWNLISKASKISAAFYIITSLAAGTVSLPFLFCAGIAWEKLPAEFYYCFAGGCLANILYYSGLFLAYKRSDISLAYPLVRALPIILTAAVTMVLGIGKTPSFTALSGMFIVFCGCLLMPLAKWSDFHWRNYFTPVLGFILMAATGTTSYTILDSLAIPIFMENAAGSKMVVCGAFMCLLEFIIALGLAPFLFRKEERKDFCALLTGSWAPYLSGVFTVGAYILVLLAMPMVTNVSFVQVFRQMGLPLGVAAGVFILKESCSSAKLTGIIVIVTGLILTAMG